MVDYSPVASESHLLVLEALEGSDLLRQGSKQEGSEKV